MERPSSYLPNKLAALIALPALGKVILVLKRYLSSCLKEGRRPLAMCAPWGVSKTQTSKTQTSDPKNSDPLGVSKTQTLKTHTPWMSRKLIPEKLRPSGCLEHSDPKNSDPLGVSKTQTRKTQTLRKLENSNPKIIQI